VFAGALLAGRAAGCRRGCGLARPAAVLRHIYGHIAAVTAEKKICLITYFHVVVGELVPKALALRRAEALAVAVAPPMLVFMALARPPYAC